MSLFTTNWNYMIGTKTVHLNATTPRVIACRYKKYYKSWLTPFSLDDAQTFERSRLNPYEAWNQEWKQSRLPTALQAFDISCLPSYLKSRLKPSEEFYRPRNRDELSLDYRRQIFGKYGLSSGIDPSTLFFDRRSFEFAQASEKIREAPVQKSIEVDKEEHVSEYQKTKELMDSIQSKLDKMPELIEKLQTKNSKQVALLDSQQRRNAQIIEEARDRFGYYVNPRDPKFQKLRAEIAERDKIEKKQQKRK